MGGRDKLRLGRWQEPGHGEIHLQVKDIAPSPENKGKALKISKQHGDMIDSFSWQSICGG